MQSRDLLRDVASATSGSFSHVCCDLLRPAANRDARWLRNAMAGIGADEKCLLEILSTREASEISAVWHWLRCAVLTRHR